MNQIEFGAILKRNPRKLSPVRLGFHLFTDALLWCGILALPAAGWASLVKAAGFAVFTFRAFGQMHDCVHGSGAPGRRLNAILGELYGIFSFLPFSSWRRLHLDHHSWTGNVEKDPSMKILARFEQTGFKMPGFVNVSWRYWIPTLGLLQHLVFWTAARRQREYIFLLGMVVYLGAIGLALGPITVALGMVLYLYMVEIINFPHHLAMVQHHGDARFAPAIQEQFTRTSLYPKWFAHLVLLNFNLHTEHHLFPALPWYQLDDIHAELKRLGLSFNTTQGNAWILKNRARPVEDVFKETFEKAPDSGSKAA